MWPDRATDPIAESCYRAKRLRGLNRRIELHIMRAAVRSSELDPNYPENRNSLEPANQELVFWNRY